MHTGNTISSSHTAEINLPGLPAAALQCHIFPALASGSLLSIGLLCDHGCIIIFCKRYIKFLLHDSLLLTGHRSPNNGLWTINLPPTQPSEAPSPQQLSIHSITTPITPTIADCVVFYHASMFSPGVELVPFLPGPFICQSTLCRSRTHHHW
jgi:hypothetical protein